MSRLTSRFARLVLRFILQTLTFSTCRYLSWSCSGYCGRRQEKCEQHDQPDQDWEEQDQEGEEQLFRTKGLAKQWKQGLLVSASEPEGLAVGTKCAPALHGNLAGFGGGQQGKANGGNIREDQQQPSDVLWDDGGGDEGQLQGSVHAAEVRSRITRVTLTVPVYKTCFQG